MPHTSHRFIGGIQLNTLYYLYTSKVGGYHEKTNIIRSQ